MPNYAAAYANLAALEYIEAVSVDSIERHADPLVRACIEGLKKMPVELLTPGEPSSLAGIVAFRHPRAELVHRLLHERNIHLMCQAGRLRVAWHGYNNSLDVEKFLSAMHEVLRHA
jgi:selenocysteine lyase/cysteine desulfurase